MEPRERKLLAECPDFAGDLDAGHPLERLFVVLLPSGVKRNLQFDRRLALFVQARPHHICPIGNVVFLLVLVVQARDHLHCAEVEGIAQVGLSRLPDVRAPDDRRDVGAIRRRRLILRLCGSDGDRTDIVGQRQVHLPVACFDREGELVRPAARDAQRGHGSREAADHVAPFRLTHATDRLGCGRDGVGKLQPDPDRVRGLAAHARSGQDRGALLRPRARLRVEDGLLRRCRGLGPRQQTHARDFRKLGVLEQFVDPGGEQFQRLLVAHVDAVEQKVARSRPGLGEDEEDRVGLLRRRLPVLRVNPDLGRAALDERGPVPFLVRRASCDVL